MSVGVRHACSRRGTCGAGSHGCRSHPAGVPPTAQCTRPAAPPTASGCSTSQATSTERCSSGRTATPSRRSTASNAPTGRDARRAACRATPSWVVVRPRWCGMGGHGRAYVPASRRVGIAKRRIGARRVTTVWPGATASAVLITQTLAEKPSRTHRRRGPAMRRAGRHEPQPRPRPGRGGRREAGSSTASSSCATTARVHRRRPTSMRRRRRSWPSSPARPRRPARPAGFSGSQR